MDDNNGCILALAGGVGGAKLVAGLAAALENQPEAPSLKVVVNTGDDFEHLGLHIAPDLDSVTYALADLNDTERGWGMRGETWQFMQALEQLGGETWFSLGDQDLATHVERTRLLNGGATLSQATSHLTRALGIAVDVAPMSDTPVRTIVHTDAGALAFQHYFVREQCRPAVSHFEFAGAEAASPSPLLDETLSRTDLRAVVICPSNPFISIDPMLSMPGVKARLASTCAPVVAVSPIIGAEAIKGPAAKMLSELGYEVSAAGIYSHYDGLLDGFVVDRVDEQLVAQMAPAPLRAAQTLMKSAADRTELAKTVLDWCDELRG